MGFSICCEIGQFFNVYCFRRKYCWVFGGFCVDTSLSFSSAQIIYELWDRAQRGCSCSLFFWPMRNIILESLGSTGYQSRARAHHPLVSVEAEVETNRKWYSQPEHPHTKSNEPKCIRYGRIGPRLCESVNQERIRGMRGRGWGENCYRGCRDLNFTSTGWIIKQAVVKTEVQGLWVCRVFPWATLTILGSVLMLN